MIGSHWRSRLLLALLAGAALGWPYPAAARDPEAATAASARAARGNPLWAVPLATLSTTRERPIFSPSRRPPPAVEDDAPPADDTPEPDETPPGETNAAEPGLTLVGTVAGQDEGFGIFLDTGSNSVVRLRTGEARDGWVLDAVQARDVTLRHGETTLTLPLKVHDSDAQDADKADDDTPAPAEDAKPPSSRSRNRPASAAAPARSGTRNAAGAAAPDANESTSDTTDDSEESDSTQTGSDDATASH